MLSSILAIFTTPQPLELFASYTRPQPLELLHYNVDLNINTLYIHDIHDQIFWKWKKNEKYMGYSIYLKEIDSHIIFSHEKNCSWDLYRQINLWHVKKFILNNMYLFPDKNIKVDFSWSGNTWPKYSYTVQQILDLPLTKFPYKFPDVEGKEVDQILPNYKIEIGKKLEKWIKFKFNQNFKSVNGFNYLQSFKIGKIDDFVSSHQLYFDNIKTYYTTWLTMECYNIDIYNRLEIQKKMRWLDWLVNLDIGLDNLNIFPKKTKSLDFIYDLDLFHKHAKLYDQYIQIYRNVPSDLWYRCEYVWDEFDPENFKVIEIDLNLTIWESIIDFLLSLTLKGDNKTWIGYIRNTIVNNVRINYNKIWVLTEKHREYKFQMKLFKWWYYTYYVNQI